MSSFNSNTQPQWRTVRTFSEAINTGFDTAQDEAVLQNVQSMTISSQADRSGVRPKNARSDIEVPTTQTLRNVLALPVMHPRCTSAYVLRHSARTCQSVFQATRRPHTSEPFKRSLIAFAERQEKEQPWSADIAGQR